MRIHQIKIKFEKDRLLLMRKYVEASLSKVFPVLHKHSEPEEKKTRNATLTFRVQTLKHFLPHDQVLRIHNLACGLLPVRL